MTPSAHTSKMRYKLRTTGMPVKIHLLASSWGATHSLLPLHPCSLLQVPLHRL